MIKAEELRVGNLVLCKNEIVRVESIYNQGINLEISGDYYGGWACDYEGYFEEYDWHNTKTLIMPILLTEEWLLNFGFEKFQYSGEGDYFMMESKNQFTVKLPTNTPGFKYTQNINWHFTQSVQPLYVSILHVHQLQNLYFALTGEELTIKEKVS